MFVDFFIRRPIFAGVCSFIFLLLGVIAIPTLPIERYPPLAAPQVTVTASYTGATAEVVESAVTIPLEQQINGVEGMRYIQSTSGNDGTSTITVTFEVDRNLDAAAIDVQNRVSTAIAQLPNEVKQTGVLVNRSSTSIVLAGALYTEHGEYSDLFLSNYADVYMRDALKRVPGVGEVRIFGERRYSMRIWLDPTRLARVQLTTDDVVRALQEQNVNVPAGAIGGQPAVPGQNYQFSVRAKSRLTEPAEFEALIVKTGADGTLVRLRDVGRAELGAQDYSSLLRFNGRSAVGLGVFQLPNANALAVKRAVTAELDRLIKLFPPGVKFRVAFDTTRVVSESIKEVLFTLGVAILLVVLVIYVFLQTLRSTLIPAVTIPVSLIGTFAFAKALGFSINNLTLFGITLATGLVVDDAIVVIENIERFIQSKRMQARVAAREAMGEVFGAVVATTLVLVAVFVPVAFFPGVTGRIYKQFSLTLAFSVLLSLFMSVTLTPAMSALLLRQSHGQSRFFRAVNLGLERLTAGYGALLHRMLRYRLLFIAVLVAALAGTYLAFRFVPGGFIPEEDQGYFIVAIQGPDGAGLEWTKQTILRAEKALHEFEEVQDVFAIGGFSFLGNGPNRGIMFINLKPWDERRKTASTLAGLLPRVRQKLAGIESALVLPFNPPAIQGVGSIGGFQFELESETGDLGQLSGTVRAISGAAVNNPKLAPGSVFSTFSVNDPQVVLQIDRERAKAMNVPLTAVFSTLQALVGSTYVNDFDFNNRTYRVYVQSDPQYRNSPNDLQAFYVRSENGRMVPLGTLLQPSRSTAPQAVTHFNLFRSAEIQGAAAPGVSSTEGLRAMEQVASSVMPPGMRYEWSGIALEQLRSGSQTLFIFALGIVFVFLVLAAQYESLVLPLIVMTAVPVALLGALLAQAARGLSNDIFCQVGLVMLIGLSSKNAILIVEFANQLRERGETVLEAAVHAAQVRLRPILMTSLAFILGVVPLMVARGAGAVSRQSLGTAVFGGMLFSTVLNLLLIPVLYVLVETARERVTHHVPHRAGEPGSEGENGRDPGGGPVPAK
jgi:hydrophobic/amphiphilic exporter-1 (mainly G- bacteria), HAE1 family